MSRIKFFAPFVLVVLLGACALPPVMSGPSESITGSGTPVTHQYDIKDFDRLVISNAFKADVTEGDTFVVEVTVDDNLEQYLDVSKQGDTLTVGLKPGLNLGLNRATMRATITLPGLRAIEANGASQVTLGGFESNDSLDVQASGASTVRGDIQAGDTTFDVSGASTVRFNGQGDNGSVTVSGASTADLADFAMKDVKVDANGASTAIVTVGGRLDAQASGASKVEYLGDPTLGRIDESGASRVAPR